MQLSKEAFEDFVAETPALSAYAHFFEQLFKRQPHVLSQAEEELLAGAQEIFGAAGETLGFWIMLTSFFQSFQMMRAKKFS